MQIDARFPSAKPVSSRGLTLNRLLGLVGGEYFELVHSEPGDLDRQIHSAMIYDAAAPPNLNQGDFVLAIGLVPGTGSLATAMADAVRAGAVALACKVSTDQERAALAAEAVRSGLPTLAISREMSWDQLFTLVRTALSTGSVSTVDTHGVPYGDLFALANAAAAMLEGPVVLDDENLEVIAFSNLDDPIDEIRRQSILQRRPPRDFIDWCESSGILPRVRQSMRPVKVTPDGGAERLVIAVKAGSDILGYLWVSEGVAPLGQDAADTLTEIARVAALQILRSRVNDDMDRRVREDMLRGMLSGRGNPRTFAARLGVDPDSQFRMLAFVAGDVAGDQELTKLTVQSLIAWHFEALVPRSAVTGVDGTIYVFLPEPAERGLSRAKRWAGDIIGRGDRQIKVRLRAAIGPVVAGVSEIPSGKKDLERLLRLPPVPGDNSITCYDDSRSQTILAELAELFVDRPRLLHGGVATLVAIDSQRGTEYLNTLHTFFDCSCDLTAAAKRLFVHRNTLKYRLSRMHDLSGIDLEVPEERLVAELQTRFFVASPDSRAAIESASVEFDDETAV
ncbi:helix-turn-helix domain-containing protein [Williamsia sp.]|uniref:helix-turn-helix domain-containing protein n=1 Tax=Williamsia sp. TaxID=1872085 RepID=UPI002F955F79